MSLFVLLLVFLASIHACQCVGDRHYTFVVKEAPYTRLCSTKNILTVNGEFPGPTLYGRKGDTINVHVHNKGDQNITIHWHGIKQPRNPWSDGPAYVTQCPIQPGKSFRQKVMLSTEEGTTWWHAHSDWSRATVHGAIVILPKRGTPYPFPTPIEQVPIILGEWWKSDVVQVLDQMKRSGGDPNVSDAYMINGQPGDLYPCSKPDTYRLQVQRNMTYHLRLIGAIMQDIVFFAVANHTLTIIGTDGTYSKAFNSSYAAVSPGQTLDVLLKADQPDGEYYMAIRAYSSANGVAYDNTTGTAIVSYVPKNSTNSSPQLPDLPYYNDTNASVSFTSRIRSLGSSQHPVYVPKNVTKRLFITLSVNSLPCYNPSNISTICQGTNGTQLAASMNNMSFLTPSIDILKAYYQDIHGVFGSDFPKKPPLKFNYTADNLPAELDTSTTGTKVVVVKYNSAVEIILQGTNILAGTDHPMHLHGYNFVVVGWGLGNFDKIKDPPKFNLADPPFQNTIAVPKNGWVAIRFQANNPGVWFMHCHIERHATWGMDVVFIVKDGKKSNQTMLHPPTDMPPC